jgi:hypothetical protein
MAEDLIVTDRKTYARHRRNNILINIEFHVGDVFDVTIQVKYKVSSSNDRFPDSLLS